MKIIIIIITLICTYILNSQETINHYNEDSQLTYKYKFEKIAERFEFKSKSILKKIIFKCEGKKGSTANITIYGDEGGNSIPLFEKEIIPSISFTKKTNQYEWIEIELNNILINEKQIFVVIENYENSIKVVTSQEPKEELCKSDDCGDFTYQSIYINNIWKRAYGAYLFDLEIESLETKKIKIFSLTNLNENYINGINQISIADINNDQLEDIITNKSILINKDNMNFEDELIADSSENSTRIVLDINNDDNYDIVSFSHDSSFTNRIFINKIDFFDTLTIDLPNFKFIESFSFNDYNRDGKQDIAIITNNENGSTLFLLKNKENSFVIEEKFELAPVISIQYVDLNRDGIKELLINYVNVDFDIYDYQNNELKSYTNEKSSELTTLNAGILLADLDNNSNNEIISIHQYDENLIDINLNNFKRTSILDKLLMNIEYDQESFSSVVGDLNNDGLKDIFLTTRCECRKVKLLHQTKNDGFIDISNKSGLVKFSLGLDGIFSDLNNDGLPELISINSEKLMIFENKLENKNNYIKIDTKGKSISKIIAKKDSNLFTTEMYNNGRGIRIQESNIALIGISNNYKIDSLILQNEEEQIIIENIDANKIYNVNDYKSKNEITPISDFNASIFPNPFNKKVSFDVTLNEIGKLKIGIYSEIGDLVKLVTNKDVVKGIYNFTWDGKNEFDNEITSGLYFYKIELNNKIIKNKLIKID